MMVEEETRDEARTRASFCYWIPDWLLDLSRYWIPKLRVTARYGNRGLRSDPKKFPNRP